MVASSITLHHRNLDLMIQMCSFGHMKTLYDMEKDLQRWVLDRLKDMPPFIKKMKLVIGTITLMESNQN